MVIIEVSQGEPPCHVGLSIFTEDHITGICQHTVVSALKNHSMILRERSQSVAVSNVHRVSTLHDCHPLPTSQVYGVPHVESCQLILI